MIEKLINFVLNNKITVLIGILAIILYGIYAAIHIPLGAVPDITNNQVQVITTSKNLATQDVEKYITYPIELEMGNLPGLKEIRSISKFGLSVVTIVFDDEISTHEGRQLIAEKIIAAQENIPSQFGTPFMGPISTGLGEIYQYTLAVAPEFKNKYSLTDLRTIQDWIVKRQLTGIPGVIEVNTWGGFLKQYELLVNADQLRSLNISLAQLYDAINENNAISGGGYIEKTNQSFFIRGEGMVKSIKDIENIVVDIREGIPLFVKDIAQVKYGHAIRFGAITANGEGEKVLGQVMMLKGANSKAVIDAVHKRVDKISTTLPKGISIKPIVDRSELIGRTTFTISENLILGCLIVIFVVILMLGNWRSGLVVASVIPLSLLIAISLMYIFNVDVNLMSLGAIDFGIIIDGTIIIVEYIAFKILSNHQKIIGLSGQSLQKNIDIITRQGASKMMHAAFFGQIIIIIVFIPILTLVDIEGKMFKPMAIAFCFALLGAMLLCLTYVPVVASLLLRPTVQNTKSITARLMNFLTRHYSRIIKWALRQFKPVLLIASLLLITTIYLFTTLGGEFVPTLDEGDFVIQPVLKTGTSLSKTIETTTKIESILKGFPEVKHVVSRIGAAEIPTDPMSMEDSDVIIQLKPKDEWETAKTKDELANKFKEALSVLPGIEIEFTQPIEMRFNELITGARSDIAIKIYGEDMDILNNKAVEIKNAIAHIAGAADISIEKTSNLPQMSVNYDRGKIAQYNTNINELNQIVSAIGGLTVGKVYEGEKRFDIVIRYDKKTIDDINDLSNTTIQLSNGRYVPFGSLATVEYAKGPAKISRDNTKRRIVIGVNVRNRDLESVVNDIQGVLKEKISIPPGYIVDFDGQYKHLIVAKNRIMIVIPIALLLISMMLYFAFRSLKDVFIIYSAIPFSIIGGVYALIIRDLPFSISAGVGFIALFGISVLNGIVLIDEFNDLKKKGYTKIYRIIRKGTMTRLRPVLLTAMAAALGFLPMAMSTSAGAEVQRPLATVVIGGLTSSTILTLLVLPILYYLYETTYVKKNAKINR